MKKFFKVIICLSAVLMTLNTAVLAGDFYEDFENFKIGSSDIGFDSFGGVVAGDVDNKYAVLVDNQSSALKSVGKMTGQVTVSGKFMQDGATYGRGLMLWNAEKTARSFLMYIDRNKINVVRKNSDGSDVNLVIASDIQANKWYDISVILDFDNHTINQIFLNNSPKLDTAMPMYNNESVQNLGYIEIKKEISEGKLCFDDLSVKVLLYPGITERLGTAKDLLTYPEGNEGGKYPHSSFTMLNDVIEWAEELTKSEGLDQDKQDEIEAALDSAIDRFKQSKIWEGPKIIYENGFEEVEISGTPSGFLVAKNVACVPGNGGRVIMLSNVSRLLYSYPKALTGKYYISTSFMQKSKGAVEYLLDISDSNGTYHGMSLFSDGSNIYARSAGGNTSVIDNYETDVWYNLKALVSIEEQKYTLYIKKSTESEYVEAGVFNFWHNMTSMGRLSNTQIVTNGVSAFVDDIIIEEYSEPFVNDVNSIEIGEYPEFVSQGDSMALSATIYDKNYELWGNQGVNWSVAYGKAEIDSLGNVVISEDYEGKIKIKAEGESGIYDYAEFVCLPSAKLTDVEIKVESNVLKISGIYNMLKYTDCSLTVGLSGMGISTSKECSGASDGKFLAEFALDGDTKTQELTISLTDAENGIAEEKKHMYYGSDAFDVFVMSFNESSEPQTVIDKFIDGAKLNINFAYDNNKAEYSQYIKDKGNATPEAMRTYIEEANLIFGVKYATRENIESVIEDGISLLNSQGCNFGTASLSQGQKESVYLAAIGYIGNSVKGVSDMLNNAVAIALNSGTPANNDAPSYKGGGSVGGGGAFSVGTNTDSSKNETKPSDSAGETSERRFEDINEALWAEKEITKLAQLNVLSGYENKVRPNDYVTRAEFAKMAAELFKMNKGSGSEFNDISENDWFCDYVGAMSKNGLINGFPDGTFRPNDYISRQDSAVILSRCVNALSIPVYTKNKSIVFDDSDKISEYAAEAVNDLYTYGVISGRSESSFAPNDNITRAETAVMMIRLYSFTENN